MLYLGIDLAWGEGSATKAANETGLAAIDSNGTIVAAGWARGIDAVVEWVTSTVEEWSPRTQNTGCIIGVDAPVVIPNATGMRLAERQVGMGYGRWKVAANPSNMAMGWKGGLALRHRLEALGFVHVDGREPAQTGARSFFECYPYTTLVGMTELGYDTERPRYKRLDRSLPAAEARAARAAACDELIRRMVALDVATPPLLLTSHPLTEWLTAEPSPLLDGPYKHREDLLDAVLCAWTASIWHRHGDTRVQVLGRDDEPDAAGLLGTIIAPARNEQRVRWPR
jgi:predicted RNase H-like nuclease